MGIIQHKILSCSISHIIFDVELFIISMGCYFEDLGFASFIMVIFISILL